MAAGEALPAETAPDDLDALLEEFDAPETAAEAEPEVVEPATTEPPADDGDLAAQVKALRAEIDGSKFREIVAAEEAYLHATAAGLAKGLSEYFDLPVSDRTARDFLLGEYQTDPAFANAYRERHVKPATWQRALDRATDRAREALQPLDSAATLDRETIVAAVRMSANRAYRIDREPNWSGMSDAEFNRRKRELAR